MTLHHEVKLDSQELFSLLLEGLGPDEFINGLVRLCCDSSAEDFLFEDGISKAMQKIIKDNT